jgi:hypothetical protein
MPGDEKEEILLSDRSRSIFLREEEDTGFDLNSFVVVQLHPKQEKGKGNNTKSK